MEFKVGMFFESWGTVNVEADSKEDLISKLNNPDFIKDLELPDNAEYVLDSYRPDIDGLDDLN